MCARASQPKSVPPAVTTNWAETSAFDAACNKVPADIEGLTAQELRAEYDNYAGPQPSPQPGPDPDGTEEVSFAVLPVDDSHAAKVMRAAAEYASAAKQWAERLAQVEKIKAELLKQEMRLDNAVKAKDEAEAELKKLVNGEQQ